MKKFLALALLVAFLGSAVIGCGGSTSPTKAPTPATTDKDKKAPS